MHEIGSMLPVWSIIPFIGMLLSIAIFPLVKPEWWERHMLKVAIAWALIFLVPFGFAFGSHTLAQSVLETVLLDYVPFIILLFGLFVVAGGIALKGTLVGTTKLNVILLLIGTVLASWIGTTGAAMLLIRPLIRANAWREKKAHIVIFFIFLVANMGGCLTPLGDPPLFLGYLRGVPFFWSMKLIPILLFNVAILIAAFILLDRRFCKKEIAAGRSPQDMVGENMREPIVIDGIHNILLLGIIVSAVVLNGLMPTVDMFVDPATGACYGFYVFDGVFISINYLAQITLILLAAFLSMKMTKKSTREHNEFTFGPIIEVATLFIGIFLTMIPALALLRAHGAELGLDAPWQFFWFAGALSSFLDNTPTYLVFLTIAGSLGATQGVATTVGTVAVANLFAISAGAVFMGANTYIGNAPNFIVKSIAEENKIKMPSFFGYMLWSICILIPVFIIDTFVFFL